jgi:hypothetical protein
MILSQNIDIKNWLPKKECLKARIIVISYLKAVLYLKIGKLTIEPLSMDVDVQLPTVGTFLAELS